MPKANYDRLPCLKCVMDTLNILHTLYFMFSSSYCAQSTSNTVGCFCNEYLQELKCKI